MKVLGDAVRCTLLVLVCAGSLLAGCGSTGAMPPIGPPVHPLHLTVTAPSVAANATVSVALDAIQDPFRGDAPSEYGTRVIGVHLTLTALADGLAYAPANITLDMGTHTAITAQAAATDGLNVGNLGMGDQVGGWLLFAVYADATPTRLTVALPDAPAGGTED